MIAKQQQQEYEQCLQELQQEHELELQQHDEYQSILLFRQVMTAG
jgi:hypothetical protein